MPQRRYFFGGAWGDSNRMQLIKIFNLGSGCLRLRVQRQ
jgi:hypothetical protein